VQRETGVTQGHPGLSADRDQWASLGLWALGLLDFQEVWAMLASPACRDNLGFQVKKHIDTYLI